MQFLQLNGLTSKTHILNFFSPKYIKMEKRKEYKVKTRKYFYYELKQLLTLEQFNTIFSKEEVQYLEEIVVIRIFKTKDKSLVKPTIRMLQKYFPELFIEFLKEMDNQFDFIINDTIKYIFHYQIDSLYLASFFLLILNGNFITSLNINTPNNEEDEFLLPFLMNFANEIAKLFDEKIDTVLIHMKDIFKTEVANLNLRLNYPIEPLGHFHYKLKLPISEITIKKINQKISSQQIEFQKIISAFFKKLMQLKGKMKVYGINNAYDPYKIAEVLSLFKLRLSEEKALEVL